jgi:hypothetical protein
MEQRRGKVYRPGDSPDAGEAPPAGLALGDTWFWHGEQTLLYALAGHPQVAPEHASVRLLGFNGARLNQYIGDGAYADVIRTRLSPDFHFSEFYLSGAANDALEYGLALHDDCSGAADPAACFSPERLDLLLYHIDEGLNGIIRTLRWAYRKTTWLQPVFLNGYDYPIPDGRGFTSAHGGWATTMMNEARVDPDLGFRKEIMRLLMDAINEQVLAEFHAPIERVFHVDSRGVLSGDPDGYAADWDNELYPSSAGFDKILERAWFPLLRPFGIVR